MKEYELKFTDEMIEIFNNDKKVGVDLNTGRFEFYFINDTMNIPKFNGIGFLLENTEKSRYFDTGVITMYLNNGNTTERIGVLCMEDRIFLSMNKPEIAKDYFDTLFSKLYLKEILQEELLVNYTEKKKKLKI